MSIFKRKPKSTKHGTRNSWGIRTCNAHRVTDCPKCGG